MNLKTCCHCGREFYAEHARTIVEERFGIGKYDQICDLCGNVCSTCATAVLWLEKEERKNASKETINI